MYVMLVFEMLEFMRALIVIVCGAQIVAPPERSPSVNMFVSVGVYFYDWCECTNAPVVGVLFVFQFRKTHKKTTQIASTIQSSESIKKVCDYTCASGMPPMSLGFRYDDE
jgi:hypothetical protein